MNSNDSSAAPSPLSSLPSPLSTPHSPLSILLAVNALGLLAAAIWLRCHALGNVPGVNGDEAWYGVQAWWLLHGGPYGGWHTPTGNPLNPLFIGPLTLLHLWLPPSIALLRSLAVAGGLAALAINWFLCRWVFDRRTAAISTLLLAVLPIDIAYSRFAWDAGQTLAVTLPVVYLSLAAVRFPDRFGRLIAASLLAQVVALWVHPTNIFVAAAIAAACIARWSRKEKNSQSPKSEIRNSKIRISDFGFSSTIVILFLACLALAAWLWAAWPLGRIAQRVGAPQAIAEAVNLYPRLFTGGTIYRYTAGSRSWFEWPLPADKDGWGLDVGIFWICAFASAWLLVRTNRLRFRNAPADRLRFRNDHTNRLRLRTDCVLSAAWLLILLAFVLIAGLPALTAGQERFAICLVAPTVLLFARGATLAWDGASTRWRFVLAAAALAGWPLLTDFHAHYFRYIERTGGNAHMTFRTAAIDPKQAALQAILEESGGQGTVPIVPSTEMGQSPLPQTWIVCSQWWNRQPIRYLALPHPGVRVPEPEEIAVSPDYEAALAAGRVWFVEFCGTPELQRVESQLAGRKPARRIFLDYAGRPVICVLHAGGH